MAEGVLGPVVLVVTFFSVLTLLIAQIAPILVESDRLYPTIIGPPSIVDTFMEEFLTDWPPSPYSVTPGDADWFWGVLNEMVEFDPGAEEHPLKCWLVRNDPFKAASADYLVFQQYFGWFGLKELHTFIPYTMILDRYDSQNNYSRITINLRYTFEVFVWTTDPIGLEDLLYTDTYNITVGVGLNDTLDSLSPWTMVGQIMTFNIPGTNYMTAAIIAFPIYMMLFYIAFVIIRSCIPLLGG